MIAEDYVSFETSKLLKEKGFEQTSNWGYREDGTCVEMIDNPINPPVYWGVTLQMAMKWLREVHNIHIEVNLSFSEDPIKYPPFYYVYILDSKSGNSVIDRAARIDGLNPLVDVDNVPRNFNTYEEACEAAIKYCLENLI